MFPALKMALTAAALQALSKETGASIETELADWETASSSAYEIINTLKKGDIQELKSYAAPPQPVKNILKATLLVFGERDWESWQGAKKLMASPSRFLTLFRDFDPGAIDATMVDRLRPFVEEDDRARSISKAVAGMSAFVRAAYEYGRDRAK